MGSGMDEPKQNDILSYLVLRQQVELHVHHVLLRSYWKVRSLPWPHKGPPEVGNILPQVDVFPRVLELLRGLSFEFSL